MGTHTAIDVFRPVLLSLLFCIPALSGCLEVERPCPEGTCFPLTSSAFNSILEEVGEIDALQLSEEYDRLSVSTLSRFTESGVSGEMYWKVEKDDERGIRLVSKLSLIHISEPTTPHYISYAVLSMKKK